MEKLLRWLPVVLCAAAVIALSNQRQPVGWQLAYSVPGWFRHGLEFLLFGIALAWGLTDRLRMRLAGWTLLGMILIGSAFAASDEWHQSFIPGREADIADWLADLAGIFLAAAAVRFWQNRSGATG